MAGLDLCEFFGEKSGQLKHIISIFIHIYYMLSPSILNASRSVELFLQTRYLVAAVLPNVSPIFLNFELNFQSTKS